MGLTKQIFRKIKRVCLWTFFLGILAAILANLAISFYAQNYVTDDLNQLSKQRVGLVLGTSRRVSSGNTNYYFTYRIQAAVKLFKAGKIDYILVSGDNSTSSYNEPKDMQTALIEAGIPEDRIVLDYAGFRTLDSIVRCYEVFDQENFTIISQEFHVKRALFIAHAHGINAQGFIARDVQRSSGMKTRVREFFARVKVFIDLLIEKEPKYLGEKEIIGDK